jgi:acyl-CoA hydrolase
MSNRAIEAQSQTLNGRPVRESCSEYTYTALPNDANLIGNVLGGHVMHLVDLCGALAAERHSGRLVATVAVDHLSFLHPVHIGQVLVLKSSVNRAFNTSMEVGAKAWSEDPRMRETRYILSAYLTFVALDDTGKPFPVPFAFPETEDEMRRYERAGRRREARLARQAVASSERGDNRG